MQQHKPPNGPEESEFDRPFDRYERRDLLDWNRTCGRSARSTKSRFLATLPEIDRIGAYADAGFRTVIELACVRGAVNRRDVEDVLLLDRRIGKHWALWRLLASGQVGISKLLLVSRFVSADNAAWWAEQLLACTRDQLAALIGTMRRKSVKPDGRRSESAAPRESTSSKRPAPAGDSAVRPTGGCNDGGARAAEAAATMARDGAAHAPETLDDAADLNRPEPGSVENQAGQQVSMDLTVASSNHASGLGGQGSEDEIPASPGAIRTASERLSAVEVSGEAQNQEPGEAGENGGTGETEPIRRVRVTVEMSAHGAIRLDDLQTRYERENGPVSKGELIEWLVRDALNRGTVPGPAVSASEPGPGVGSPDGNGLESNDDQAVSSAAGPRSATVPGRRIAARRMLEVIYRNADTGERWLPSRLGPISVGLLPTGERERYVGAASFAFEDLRARALAAAARHERRMGRIMKAAGLTGERVTPETGREVPAAVETYLMARSGGLCERAGCRRRAVHFHHLDEFSVHRRHDIDRMLAICTQDHDALHAQLLVVDPFDARNFLPVSPGTPKILSRVNSKVQSAKRQARGPLDVGA